MNEPEEDEPEPTVSICGIRPGMRREDVNIQPRREELVVVWTDEGLVHLVSGPELWVDGKAMLELGDSTDRAMSILGPYP